MAVYTVPDALEAENSERLEVNEKSFLFSFIWFKGVDVL